MRERKARLGTDIRPTVSPVASYMQNYIVTSSSINQNTTYFSCVIHVLLQSVQLCSLSKKTKKSRPDYKFTRAHSMNFII